MAIMKHKPPIVPKFKKENGFETSKERSRIMRRIKSENTKPEIMLRKALWHRGVRYRVNYKSLPGSPDIVITRYKIVIFVDGEFWHGYNWDQKRTRIASNRAFWIPKIERNIQRDKENNNILIKNGWTILRFWEHEITNNLSVCINDILQCFRVNNV